MAPQAGRNQQEQQTSSPSETQRRITTGLGWFSIGLGLAEIVSPGALARLIGMSDEDRTRNILRIYGLRELAAGVGILSQANPSPWLWARLAGDVLDLSSLGKAMASNGLDYGKAGVATAAVLGVTALDLYCAQRLSASREDTQPAEAIAPNVLRSITIDRSAEEIYGFWRDFSRLPQIFDQLESVQVTDTNRSHWRLQAPMGRMLEWDAEVIQYEPNSRIAWQSLSTAAQHSGSVRFERATGGRGTKVTVEMQLGTFGVTLGKLFGALPEQQVDVALHNLKQLLETGEVVKSDASIHRGMHAARPPEESELQARPMQAAASM